MLIAYLLLIVAVVAEIIGTTALKLSDGFTKITPIILMIIFYALTVYLSALILKILPFGITYALWSAFGIVCAVLVGVFYFKEKIDLAALLGLGLIISGIVIIHLFSKNNFN